jgi:hypothetical protein
MKANAKLPHHVCLINHDLQFTEFKGIWWLHIYFHVIEQPLLNVLTDGI